MYVDNSIEAVVYATYYIYIKQLSIHEYHIAGFYSKTSILVNAYIC